MFCLTIFRLSTRRKAIINNKLNPQTPIPAGRIHGWRPSGPTMLVYKAQATAITRDRFIAFQFYPLFLPNASWRFYRSRLLSLSFRSRMAVFRRQLIVDIAPPLLHVHCSQKSTRRFLRIRAKLCQRMSLNSTSCLASC